MSSPVDAIAKIVGAKVRGTGFLVRATDGRLLVLTAAHVADGGPCTVTFAATGFSSTATLAKRADGTSLRGPADWAALACHDPIPSTIVPIALDDPDNFPTSTDRFDTFGYPNLYGLDTATNRGGPLHGTLRETPGGALRPYCVELAPGDAVAAQGISGGPCLVADVAIGVITNVLNWSGKMVAGSMVLVSSRTIVDESGGVFELATDPELPYRRLVVDLIKGVGDRDNLAAMAKVLDLASTAGKDVETLRRRVVRGLLSASPDKVAAAMLSVLPLAGIRAAAAYIIVFRESLWLHSAVVRDALAFAERGGAVALDADFPSTVRALLRRVSWLRDNAVLWYRPAHCAIVADPPLDPAALVTKVEGELRNQIFRGTAVDRAKINLQCQKRRIFVVIWRHYPLDASSQALAAAFPDLRVVFLSRRQPADPLGLWLDSPVPPDDAWRAVCDEGREALRGAIDDFPTDETLETIS